MGELSGALMGSTPIGKNFAGVNGHGARGSASTGYITGVGQPRFTARGVHAERVTRLLHAVANVQDFARRAISPDRGCICGSRSLAGPGKADCEPAIRRYCLPRQLKRKPRSWVPTFDSGARGHELPAGGTVRRTEWAPAFPSPQRQRTPASRCRIRIAGDLPLDSNPLSTPIHDQQA